jgi:hypothetical protein
MLNRCDCCGPKPGPGDPDQGADSPSTMPEDGCNG